MSKQGKAERTKGELKFEQHEDWSKYYGNLVYHLNDKDRQIRTFDCILKYGEKEEMIANAQFICKAVNAHEKLVEALEEAYFELRFHNWHNTTVGNKIDALLKSLTP